ncbi:MAG TPA: hypothetical protein VK152_08425 [Paludibacter sp.]|nr:hypothetical protein [Paludibacter sp.]
MSVLMGFSGKWRFVVACKPLAIVVLCGLAFSETPWLASKIFYSVLTSKYAFWNLIFNDWLLLFIKTALFYGKIVIKRSFFVIKSFFLELILRNPAIC